MAKRCPEEFNPWPPFVDIFASVILVMMLFLLITIVNIGYYAQFKYKVSYTASVETKSPVQPEDQTKVQQKKEEKKETKEKIESFSFHKVIPQALSEKAKGSLFEGGEAAGNAVQYAAEQKDPDTTKQKLIKKDLKFSILFKDKEIFLNSASKRKLKLFASDIRRRSKLAEFTIYTSDPKNVIGSTIAKQISLGRALNVQNIIKNSRIDKKRVKINLRKDIPSSSNYGEVLIRVHIP
ncbi:MAG: hypothetical protein ABXS93_09600 [Sulfurimonas sp.]